MVTLHLNRHDEDAARRERIFAGDFYLYTDLAASRALCRHARDMVDEAFAGLDPERAQFELEVDQFIKRVGPRHPTIRASRVSAPTCAPSISTIC